MFSADVAEHEQAIAVASLVIAAGTLAGLPAPGTIRDLGAAAVALWFALLAGGSLATLAAAYWPGRARRLRWVLTAEQGGQLLSAGAWVMWAGAAGYAGWRGAPGALIFGAVAAACWLRAVRIGRAVRLARRPP